MGGEAAHPHRLAHLSASLPFQNSNKIQIEQWVYAYQNAIRMWEFSDTTARPHLLAHLPLWATTTKSSNSAPSYVCWA